MQIVLVSLSVSSDFGDPVASVRLRYARAALAIVAVPEAAMDEDHFLPANEGDVGLAGEFGPVEAVAATQFGQELANDELRGGVRGANTSHHLRTIKGRSLTLLHRHRGHVQSARPQREPLQPDRPRLL